jgi:hypothetical protein
MTIRSKSVTIRLLSERQNPRTGIGLSANLVFSLLDHCGKKGQISTCLSLEVEPQIVERNGQQI